MKLFHFARHVPLCQRGERPGLKGRVSQTQRFPIALRDRAGVDTQCVAIDADDLLCFVHFALVPAPALPEEVRQAVPGRISLNDSCH